MATPTSVLSKIMKTRASIPFLRNAAKTAIKVDVTLASGRSLSFEETPIATSKKNHRPNLKAAVLDLVDDSASSVVFSWPDNGSPIAARQHRNVLRTLEKALRESRHNVTTTKPFFMLDGGGRRMASLSILGNQEARMMAENKHYNSGYCHETPGTWVQNYCSLRTSASS
ncbi:hypothetical protein IV203_003103 [Nitzschia inconspicua]|uniref:Uncharacterized protein n=1 Tax=Nitzschia inconspicua TaxID=303405 RepID=A0A9K3L2N0_9STRA|nr:hypothetical protein IV203_003103 [Nitzschia inconspicua]